MGYKIIVNDAKAKFSACHFLKEHPKCSRLHGHNYYVSVEISDNLDENYFVVDFMELKEKLKEIIEPLDHYILIPTESKKIEVIEKSDSIEVINSLKKYIFPKQDVCLLPLPATTSEILAKFIYDKLKIIYKTKKIIVKVGESKGSIASYEE
ncbi:MAG: 6-pyruvoyl tetrahydropterin synthase family protein [Candidatus Lokiarchaeota archaeon]|nr:6-pyruvoyl tetrahydropterin synthase family protein [Candidatus Lokiarchaeota archaeon]